MNIQHTIPIASLDKSEVVPIKADPYVSLGRYHAAAVAALTMPPRIRGLADAEDFQLAIDYINSVVGPLDAFLKEYAELLREHNRNVDVSDFTNVIRDALDGNGLYGLECARDELQSEQDSFDQEQHNRCVRMGVD